MVDVNCERSLSMVKYSKIIPNLEKNTIAQEIQTLHTTLKGGNIGEDIKKGKINKMTLNNLFFGLASDLFLCSHLAILSVSADSEVLTTASHRPNGYAQKR